MGHRFEQLIIEHNPGDDIESLTDVAPGDDYDGDGSANRSEFDAGTDPASPGQSVPVASGLLTAALFAVAGLVCMMRKSAAKTLSPSS